MIDLYYSFEIESESKTIDISVDDSSVSLIYPKKSIFTPQVSSLDNKYEILLPNIFKGIDIKLELFEDNIKETIILKSKKCERKIRINLEKKDCECGYGGSNKGGLGFFEKNSNHIFTIKKPYVVDKKIPNSVCQFRPDNNFLEYYFNIDEISDNNFPLKIDPSIVFEKKITKDGSKNKSILSKTNNMFICGDSVGEYYVDSSKSFGAEVYYNNYVYNAGLLYSDDVLFEPTFRANFPYLNYSLKSVLFRIKQKDLVFEKFSNSISREINSSGFPFFYAICQVPSQFVTGEMMVTALVKFEENLEVVYERMLSYINEVKVGVPTDGNFVFFDEGKTSIDRIDISYPSKFEALEYRVFPFDFKPSSELKKSETEDYLAFPVSENVEFGSPGGNNLSFNFSIDNIPDMKEEFIENGYSITKGSNYSFANNIEAVLRSAINLRSNVQENNSFKSRYALLKNEDFYFYSDDPKVSVSESSVNIDGKNFYFYLRQKPSFYFQSESGKSISDYIGNGVSCSYNSVLSLNNNNFSKVTLLEFDNDVFYFDFDSTFDVLMEDDTIENWSLNRISSNCYYGGYIVFENNSNIYSHKILYNDINRMVIKGNCYNEIINSSRFSIFLFSPNRYNLSYSNYVYSSEGKSMLKNSILNNGDIQYGPIKVSFPQIGSTSIFCNFSDDNYKFDGITKKFSLSSQDLVVSS